MLFDVRKVDIQRLYNMKKEQIKDQELEQERILDEKQSLEAAAPEEDTREAEAPAEEQTPEQHIAELEKRVAELEDKNLRMMAEFDNYRRRTNREKLDLMATAGERIFTEMLPLVDDFERAVAAMDKTDDIEAVREGIRLIQQKFIGFLNKQDVHAIETDGVDFNTDEHEAITTFAAGEEQRGKVIDCTQRGYKLGDKVIRFAKVVVGE